MRLIPLVALIAMAAACPVAPIQPGSSDRGLVADGGNAPNDGGITHDGGDPPASDASTPPTPDAGPSEDAGEQPSHDLIGTWLADNEEEDILGIAFREDNRMVILDNLNPCTPRHSATYTIEGTTLIINIDGETRVPFSWDEQDLLLDTEDGEMRFVRATENCHAVPETTNIVGTWEVLDEGDPQAPEMIAFTDNGLMLFLRDPAQCNLINFFEYRIEADQLFMIQRGTETPVPYTLIGDVLSIANDTRMRRSEHDCHERFRQSGEMPPAIIGTYTSDPPPPQGAVLIALRADNTLVGISEQAGCVEAFSWTVRTYGNSLVVENDQGNFPVQWRREGSSVILSRDDGEELTLSRVRTDCHTLR